MGSKHFRGKDMGLAFLALFAVGVIAMTFTEDDVVAEDTTTDADTETEETTEETVTTEDGTITGTSLADTLLVDSAEITDVLAGDGDDIITTQAGEEDTPLSPEIYGGEGDDQIDARQAATADVYGGAGDDILQGETYSTFDGSSDFYGGDGDDQLDLHTSAEFDAFDAPSVTPALYGDGGDDTFNINLTEGALDFDSFDESGEIPDSGSDLVARIQDFNAEEDTLNVDITSFVEDTEENPTYTGFTLTEVPATDDVPAYVEMRLNFELESGQDFTSIINLSGGPFPTAEDINIIQ